jgi:hypothetical protein
VNPNATWNVSLESYHPYLQPEEVSKTPTTLGTYGSLPKIRKGRFGILSPLGVNGIITYTKGIYNEDIAMYLEGILINIKILKYIFNDR